jgi:hypothetical protein
MGDEEACRELQWVEDNRGDIPHVIHGDDSPLCHGDDVPVFRDQRDSMGVQGFLRDVVVLLGDRRGKGVAGCRGPWSKTMEPNGFAIPTSPRTLGFSCPRVELPLPTHMRCQSMADRIPLLVQEETLLDMIAPVRAVPAYLRNHSQGRRSRSASTPSASNLLVRGPLSCIRTRLQKRAESATGRTLSLTSADVLVQIRSDLRLRVAAFPPARRATTAPPPPQE